MDYPRWRKAEARLEKKAAAKESRPISDMGAKTSKSGEPSRRPRARSPAAGGQAGADPEQTGKIKSRRVSAYESIFPVLMKKYVQKVSNVPKVKQPPKCSRCHQAGHNRRSCTTWDED